jgi:uncharacterized membrane protein
MSVTRAAQFVSIIFTGLFTGLMLTFLIVIQRTLDTLTATEYTKVMQQLINAADNPPVVPMIVIISLVAPLVTLFSLRRQPRSLAFLLTFAAWLIFFVGAFLVTIILNVPINTAITGWSPANPPADWVSYRDQWGALSYIRTPVSAVSFILHMTALVLPVSKSLTVSRPVELSRQSV